MQSEALPLAHVAAHRVMEQQQALPPPLPPSSIPSVRPLFSSLPAQLEHAIKTSLYRNRTEALKSVNALGLMSPLWLWTHPCFNERDVVEKPLAKITHLLQWCVRNRIDFRRVAVVTEAADLREKIQALLSTVTMDTSPLFPPELHGHRPSLEAISGVSLLFPHDSLAQRKRRETDGAAAAPTPQYDLILYVMGRPNSLSDSQQQQQNEVFLASNIAAATTAFVVIADAAWLSTVMRRSWPAWGVFVQKLEEEHAGMINPSVSDISTLSRDTMQGGGGGLVGPHLPICCSVHPLQRETMSGLSPIGTVCKRLCLRPHHCHHPEHVCDGPCHPHADHRRCPFRCDKELPCGHKCLMKCGASKCNCLNVISESLPCSHQVVVGVDPETDLPVYATVPHEFHGYCVDRDQPCAVVVPTMCAKCQGKFEAPCHQLQSAGHTFENPTVTCNACIKLERAIRSEILGEVLLEADKKKRDMKALLVQEAHVQRKAATRGVFQRGARVTIRDVSRVTEPLSEEDFPGKKFVSLSADHDALHKMLHGAFGVIDSPLVDLDNIEELRYLVRLCSGEYTIVADSGMDFLHGDLTHVVNTNSAAPLLLLSAPPSTSHVDCDASSMELRSKRAAMMGKWYLLMNTTTVAPSHPRNDLCIARGDIALTGVMVNVIGEDPEHRTDHVLVRATIFDRNAEAAALEALLLRPSKRARDDEDAPELASDSDIALSQSVMTFEFSCRMIDLEPLNVVPSSTSTVTTAPSPPPMVSVTKPPGHQAVHISDKDALGVLMRAFVACCSSLQLQQMMGCAPSLEALTASVVSSLAEMSVVGDSVFDVPFQLIAAVNVPMFSLDDVELGFERLMRGPVALLRSAPRPTVSHGRLRSSRTHPHIVARAPPTQAMQMLVMVPLMFVATDPLVESMARLDKEAMDLLHLRVAERFEKETFQLACRNDELALQLWRALGPATPGGVVPFKAELSEPTKPVPTPDALLLLHANAEKEVRLEASLAATCAREKVLMKLEAFSSATPKFVEWLKSKQTAERTTEKEYIEKWNLHSLNHRR